MTRPTVTVRRLRNLGDQVASLAGPDHRVRVACLHAGRVGSTVLGNMLAAHPEILWDGELFQGVRLEVDDPRRRDPRGRLVSRIRRAGRRIYGLEVKLQEEQHLTPIGHTLPSFVELLGELRFTHHVLLLRRNLLRAIVSWKVAASRGAVHVRDRTPGLTRVSLAAARPADRTPYLVRKLEELERHHAAARELFRDRPLLELSYEDDIEGDPRVAYRRVCTFLGVPPEAVEPDLKKTNPYPLQDVLENYVEVRDVLEGTPYAWMLEAP